MPSSAADNVIGLYQSHAAAWVRLRGSEVVEQNWLNAFREALPHEGCNVLDIGCGSGKPVAGYLIAKGCRITGIDGAAALIERAKESFPDHAWLTADMRTLPHLGTFDGIVAWHSLFHLRPEEQRPMFATFARLAVPGAALLFTSGTTHGETIGSFEEQPLYHASLDSAEYRRLFETNGFETIRHVESDPTCGGATVWLARKARNVR